MGLVRSKQSPIERNLINRMRACVGRLRRRSLVFNLGFVDEHDGDVIAYGIYAVALAALQAIPVMDHFYGCLTDRADQNFQQLRINRHAGMVAQGHTRQVFVGGGGWVRFQILISSANLAYPSSSSSPAPPAFAFAMTLSARCAGTSS